MDAADIAPGSADLIVAMGSVQYTVDPAATICRFAEWVRPGGTVCVYVDSCLGLVLDLLREGRPDEALLRSNSQRGRFMFAGETADLHLYDRRTLQRDLAAAGLVDIHCRGLLISASALGRKACAEAMASNPDEFLEFERQISANPALADAGLHMIAWGRRPG